MREITETSQTVNNTDGSGGYNPATQPEIIQPSYDNPFATSEWIVCEIIQATCFIIALYILYALSHFYTVQRSRRIYSGQSVGSRWLEKMCIFSVICAIIRFTNNQVLLFTGWQSQTQCTILLNISIALYLVSLFPIYLFLWLRQRIFYSNKALKHLYDRTVRFVSWATIFCFIIVTIVSMVLFVVEPHNNASGRVCKTRFAKEGTPDDTAAVNVTDDPDIVPTQGLKVNTIAGLLASAIQSSFLALFLYPIMDSKLRSARNLNVRCHNSLLRLIRRSFVLSGVCIVTDLGIAFGVKGVYSLFPNAVFALVVMYDVNLIINILCIITTFRRWRRMLFPWMYGCCGEGILPPNSKTEVAMHRHSNAGINVSNVGSIRIKSFPSRKEIEMKPPIVDVLAISDGDNSDDREKQATQNNNTRENGKEGKARDTLPSDESRGNERFSNNFTSFFFNYPSFRSKSGRRKSSAANGKASDAKEKTLVSTSHISLRSKQSKNVVTTKIVVMSESHVVADTKS